MIHLDPAEHAVLERAQGFVAAHLSAPTAPSAGGAFHESNGRSLISAAADAGLLSVQVPTASGGAGLSFVCKMRMAQILAGADFGVAMAVVNSHNVAEQVARLGSPQLAAATVPGLMAGTTTGCTALTEPGAGSDFSAIQTTATPTPSGWVLNGTKTWITNAVHADWVVVYAQTKAGSGAAGVAAFLVDTHSAGFERHAGLPMGPLPTIGAGAFTLNHCVCPADHLLAPPGEAFKDIMRAINGARTYVAAMCCGMVAECLRLAQAYGNTRQAFGKPLLAHQGWRWALADADIDLQAAQLLVDQAAQCVDLGLDAQTPSARAKVFATRMAQRHIAALLHSMGAEGLRDIHPFVRHLNAAQVAGFVDGSTEMLLERIAKDFKVTAGN